MKAFSYTYQKQPFYQLMLMNVKNQLKTQKNDGLSQDDFNIFEVTSVIGIAVGLTKEEVMSDYLLSFKK